MTDGIGQCASGEPELHPVRDLHVGVITSSLGSHGASDPRDACVEPDDDDHAHLLGALRGIDETWNGTGFLAWDPMRFKAPPGDGDAAIFSDKFGQMIRAAGEHGCGFESTLEAWYRFLIDPEPPRNIVVSSGKSTPLGIDQTILDQRAQFLRPDSVVAIVMLTDENDCSIVDDGYGYAVATAATPTFRSTSVCRSNPNDRCCQSCGDATAVEGCPAVDSDPECQKGTTNDPSEDDMNLRCWDQKRRFGLDLLYPTSRYVDALKSPVVTLRSGEVVPNPLFRAESGRAARDPSLVLLAGIVGVPWQDLADEESFSGSGLRYLTALELEASARWDVVLGRPEDDPPAPPLDPLMLETPSERMGGNPITNDQLVPSSSTNPRANPINGHEQLNTGRDLQYACIFPLAEPRVCDPEGGRGCDCYPEDTSLNRPLCQPPGGGPAGDTQYFAKAYPGLRHLAVLKQLGANAIVASVCPKVIDEGRPDHGYGPAIDALVEAVRGVFKDQCLPRELPLAADGRVSCTVIEALAADQGCGCFGLGLGELTTDLASATRREMKEQAICGDDTGVDCESICLCEVPQLTGVELAACQGDPAGPLRPGFCYVNAMADETQVGNPDLVRSCRADQRRAIRFVGDAPRPGSTAWISCAYP